MNQVTKSQSTESPSDKVECPPFPDEMPMDGASGPREGSKGMDAAEHEIKRLRAVLATHDNEYRELCFLRYFYHEQSVGKEASASIAERARIRKNYLGPIPEGYADV